MPRTPTLAPRRRPPSLPRPVRAGPSGSRPPRSGRPNPAGPPPLAPFLPAFLPPRRRQRAPTDGAMAARQQLGNAGAARPRQPGVGCDRSRPLEPLGWWWGGGGNGGAALRRAPKWPAGRWAGTAEPRRVASLPGFSQTGRPRKAGGGRVPLVPERRRRFPTGSSRALKRGAHGVGASFPPGWVYLGYGPSGSAAAAAVKKRGLNSRGGGKRSGNDSEGVPRVLCPEAGAPVGVSPGRGGGFSLVEVGKREVPGPAPPLAQ